MSSSIKKDSESFTGAPVDVVLDAQTAQEVEQEQDAHLGVKTVEASEKVYGKYSKWALFISLGLASYIYSLDGSTTYTYLAYAASAFNDHGLISTIQVAQSVIVSVGKPVIAKLSDVTSRGTAYLAVLIFYVVGYIVIASARNIGAVAGGIVIYAVGYTGLQLLTQVIIADITTLKWRGLVSGLMSAPFIINGFIGANVSTQVLERSGWRWGYGMFAILVPASLAPLICVLFWAEWKAKKLGLVQQALRRTASGYAPSVHERVPIVKRVWRFVDQLDLIGLVVLGVAVALILLPLTLAQTAKSGWHNPSMIAMLVVGIVLLFVFTMWDTYVAKRPVVPFRFLRNRSFIGAAWIGFFDFISFYLTNTYLYSFVIVVKPWSLIDVTYFTSTQTVALTIFGIMAGGIMTWTRRYKWLLFIGLCIRLLGVGLMIHTRGEDSSDAEIVWTQILQGIGGGFAATAAQVGAQASVPHADVASITAVVLLWTEIGGACGSAIAGAIWTNVMPGRLARHLPQLSQAAREALFGSITDVTEYPLGNPIRQGVIAAYGDTMRILCIAATCLSVIPIVCSLIMPDWYLGDKQNAVDAMDLAGERSVDESEPDDSIKDQHRAVVVE